MLFPDERAEPLAALSEWLQAARDASEPVAEAMAVATISPDGWPSVRMVILRGLDEGLVFYTDAESAKGADLAGCPRAAAVLHWLTPAHRQVRVSGLVETVSDDEADAYWRARRPQARWAAAATPQSQVAASREVLEERVDAYRRLFPGADDVGRPSRWCGYRIIPTVVEFWQQAADEVHDRLRYRRDGAGWAVERLSP